MKQLKFVLVLFLMLTLTTLVGCGKTFVIQFESNGGTQIASVEVSKKDFYLAKNAFNEVLKENVYDEVARWYLFSCEYNLHSNENNMSYGLFDDKVYSQSLK